MALASRLQAKQKEVERLIIENKNLHQKIGDYESDAKMYKKLANKQDMPTKYLLQDIEKGEKELNMTHRRN